MDEDLYAEQLYCLGRYYHDAMIGVEINFSEHPARVQPSCLHKKEWNDAFYKNGRLWQ